MAITRVQKTSAVDTTFASTVSAASITPAAGNCLIAVVAADVVPLSGCTVSDSQNNAWTRITTLSAAATFDLEIWASLNVVNAATIVRSHDTGGGVDSEIIVEEWSGIATTNAIDQSHSATGESNAPNSGASPATTQADELVIGAAVGSSPCGYTLGAGYTNLDTTATSYDVLAFESKVVAATGAQTATFSLSASPSWVCSVATLKGIAASTSYVPRHGFVHHNNPGIA